MHAEHLPTLVLIAQAIFLLDHGQTHTKSATDHTTHALATAGVGNRVIGNDRLCTRYAIYCHCTWQQSETPWRPLVNNVANFWLVAFKCIRPIMWRHDSIHKTRYTQRTALSSEENWIIATGSMYGKFHEVKKQGDHYFCKIIFHDFSMTFPGPKKWKLWPIGTTFFSEINKTRLMNAYQN